MEVFRIAVTLVLLTGSFWEDIANIFNIISTKKKKINNNNNNTKKEIITIRPQAQINIDGNNAVHDRDIINIIAKNQDDMNENNCDDFHILADDMMRKILSQLPPETMMKCKSVSRSWRRLIIEGCSFLIDPRRDHPYPLSGLIICRKGTFMTLSPERDMFYCLLPLRDRGSMITRGGILSYKNRLIQPNNLVMAESFLQHLPLSSLHHDFREILDCCNGLLLFRDSNLGNSSLTTPPCYVIGNPTTGEFVKIPGEIIDTNFASGALAYDPSESLHYKVVMIIAGQSNMLKIFSSDTLRWTKSYFNLENTGTLEVQSYQSIYSGGILYKLSTSGQLIRIFTETNIVQSVDLPMVRFADSINIKSECIGITGGRLNYALLADSELKIFILEGSGSGSNTNDLNWSLNLHQKLDSFCTRRCQFRWPKVYAFHPQNPGNIFMCCEIIEDGCSWWTNTFMICYNYKTNNIQEHAHLDPRLLTGISNTFAFPFTRSLLPLSSSQGRIPYHRS